jgi:hypothetical protein
MNVVSPLIDRAPPPAGAFGRGLAAVGARLGS